MEPVLMCLKINYKISYIIFKVLLVTTTYCHVCKSLTYALFQVSLADLQGEGDAERSFRKFKFVCEDVQVSLVHCAVECILDRRI